MILTTLTIALLVLGRSGEQPNTQDTVLHRTAQLHNAVISEDHLMIETLVKAYVDPLLAINGRTAVGLSAAHKKHKSLQSILRSMSQGNREYAARVAFDDCLKYDFAEGLEVALAVTRPTNLPIPAISWATYLKAERCIDVLVKHNYQIGELDREGRSALVYAAIRGYRGLIRKLVQIGIPVNSTDRQQNSVLHFGASQVESVEELLRLGAVIDAKNLNGRTPLFNAMNLDVAMVFVKSKARVDIIDREGFTADRWLKLLGYVEVGSYIEKVRLTGPRH